SLAFGSSLGLLPALSVPVSFRTSQARVRPSFAKAATPPARTVSGADIDLRPPVPPPRGSAPSLSCKPPESADAADPDAATDPSRNRRAQTWDGYDAATRWSKTGRCASENRLHPAARASRVEKRAWCSCPSLPPSSVLYQFQPDRKSPLATSPTG